MERDVNPRAVVALGVAILLWASAFAGIRAGLEAYTPGHLALLRFLVHRGEELPAVSLYKVGGFYCVLDGHHRVSVACYHGVEWVDAYVTEFGAVGVWSDLVRDRESA